MSKRPHKYSLLLDEGFPIKIYFPRVKGIHNIKHITADLKRSGISDSEVYKIATKQNRLLITFNYRDFKNLIKDQQAGVIGVSKNLSTEQIDLKLTSFLSRKNKNELYGKFNYISGETK